MPEVLDVNERFELSIKLLVTRDNGALLLLRRPSYIGDLFWDLPGGRLLPGETIDATITRELREEIGWTGVLPGRHLVEASLWQPNAPSVVPKVLLFYRLMIDIEDVVLSAEHVDHTWARTSKLDELTTARLEPELRDMILRMNPPSVLDEMLEQLEARMPEEAPPTEADIQRIVRDLDLTSCDFVGDSGCVDPDCWRCHSPLRPENLRTLAKNLAAAAMLCRAWNARDLEPAWRPGCQLDEAVPSSH